MGSSVSSLMDSLENKEEQEKEANDALNSLIQLAQARQTSFYEHIRSPDFDPGLVPMSKVIYKYQNFECGVSNTADGISSALSASLGDFISGDVAKGVETIVGSCLSYLMGNYSANASSMTMYTLTTGSLGGLARIDTDFYSYQYTSNTLTSITKNVVVCSIVISSANVEGLNKNDIAAIVQTLYAGVDAADQAKILDQLWTSVQDTQAKGVNAVDNADVSQLFGGLAANVNFQDISKAPVASPSPPLPPVGAPQAGGFSVRVRVELKDTSKSSDTVARVQALMNGYLHGLSSGADVRYNFSSSPSTDMPGGVDIEVTREGSTASTLTPADVKWPLDAAEQDDLLKSYEILGGGLESADPGTGDAADAAPPTADDDVKTSITSIFGQVVATTEQPWTIAQQLIKYVAEVLGDLEDALGTVNASVVAGAIYDAVIANVNLDAEIVQRQADVVQYLLGGMTYYDKWLALPKNKNQTLPLSVPGSRSEGAEKLISFLVALCDIKGSAADAVSVRSIVLAFYSNLASRRVVLPVA